ncbi:ABC transporter permease [Paraburkholderia caballeronis]|uniref:Nucleoside ABC transporter membrane protein n=1 Tax=Paraburkholderia caballeronis TaxID=416943 RepID=A0A1H7LAI5_9BURK|nr:ABC transporter permease [Paraburkholderia caballeronis]PXW28370.1 nucleoside ABC transporter membrane protein [Paraburkholderia caballeronis]PXX03736.1 nucleoside ABC transporter membrane protein [Paraburkholderia caballeronis]RAK04480.1 nucleoside ABC transporter membrane protein [Paraburkholderia caballeronis]TDV19385.1 nucleoside ABC transporter membrane protein [Paraburkholderia caballeronis]TDV21985.1 nucleoside ABC transporter membrane protein [Paraburkholderia caballeronis]
MNVELLAVFAGASIRLAAPMMLASTGELVSERAGVLNMSVEGMMLTGAFIGATFSWLTGNPLVGLLCAIAGVIPLALLQAFLSVTLRANQIVTGIGINILALGGTTLAYREVFGERSSAAIPGLAHVSPVPGVLSAVFDQVWLLYAGVAMLIATSVVMRRTSLGIALHAAGVAPRAVDQSGLSVARLRYGAVVFSGVMSATAGCFISIGDIHTFTEGMTNGTGYLAIAAIIFGNWKTGRTALACLLFGAATAMQFQLPMFGLHVPTALLVMLPYLLALVAVAGLIGRQTAPPALAQPFRR